MAELLTKQAAVAGVSRWRESQRFALKVPVKIKVIDDYVKLRTGSTVEGRTYDISKGGAAVGLEVFLFLPKGLKVSIEFAGSRQDNSNSPLQAKGEIVYSRMEKSKKYLLGIKFSDIDQGAINQLLKLADQE
jgi:c-di-GMP-binding flagellar brake protein YcgR